MMYAQQDTLITKKGRIYLGYIVNDDSKYIEFQPQNWTSTTKISYDRIGKLISSDGSVLIQNSFEPIDIVNSTKFIYNSMNIKEKAVYDAKKNANRWIFYPTLAILPSVSLGTASFFIGGENGISDEVAFFAAIFGGSMGLIGSHHLFRKLDKKNAVNTSTENIELYEKTYFKEFKKRKLQNIFVGSALISLTTIVIIAIINPLEGLGQSPPLYDGKGPQ